MRNFAWISRGIVHITKNPLSRMPSVFSSSAVSEKSPIDTSVVAMADLGGIGEPRTNKPTAVADGTDNTIGLIQIVNERIPRTAPKAPNMNDRVADKNSCPASCFLGSNLQFQSRSDLTRDVR